MIRGNCDYIFLQPIYNKTQRDTLWDLEAAFMDRNDFNVLMDQVIVRENLEGNSAADPKKKVQIMICADFEDSSLPQEKVRCRHFAFEFVNNALQVLPLAANSHGHVAAL